MGGLIQMNIRTANTRKNRAHRRAVMSYRPRTRRQIRKDDMRWKNYWQQYKAPGIVYHSCTLHPCYVESLDIDGDSIYGISLLDGSYGHGCSLRHCGVYMMKPDEIEQHKNAWEKDGERGLLTLYYGSEEAADEFIKNYR